MTGMEDDRDQERKDFERDFIRQLAPNSFSTANWMHLDLGQLLLLPERAIFEFVLYRTYGFGKFEDYISYDQFQFGIAGKDGKKRGATNLSPKSIKKAMDVLIKVKAISRTKEATSGKVHNIPARYEVQRFEMEIDYDWLNQRREGTFADRAYGGKKSKEGKLIKAAKLLEKKRKEEFDSEYDSEYEASLNEDCPEGHG